MRVGLGPAGLRRGDRVAILFGSVVPFVLRWAGGLWAIIEPCYVQGVMDGQFVRSWQAERGARPAEASHFC